jgi:hypothetical protein
MKPTLAWDARPRSHRHAYGRLHTWSDTDAYRTNTDTGRADSDAHSLRTWCPRPWARRDVSPLRLHGLLLLRGLLMLLSSGVCLNLGRVGHDEFISRSEDGCSCCLFFEVFVDDFHLFAFFTPVFRVPERVDA